MERSIAMALAGGALIGLAATWTLLSAGRISGISGMVGGLFSASGRQGGWRLSFVLGLLAGGVVLSMFFPQTLAGPDGRSPAMLVVAGLLVGFGTRMGNGCTSGHGVCGLSRLSARSMVATGTFMATGFAVATVVGLYFGGGA